MNQVKKIMDSVSKNMSQIEGIQLEINSQRFMWSDPASSRTKIIAALEQRAGLIEIQFSIELQIRLDCRAGLSVGKACMIPIALGIAKGQLTGKANSQRQESNHIQSRQLTFYVSLVLQGVQTDTFTQCIASLNDLIIYYLINMG